jgi:tetratricopeptide (TPR) repeat protein
VQKEGRAHYQKGLASYHLGDFPTAIEEFKTAYTMTQAPRLLFDIAQAQRLNKEYEAALYSYNTYLRLVPGAPNRADVQSRIGELAKLIAERPVEPPPSPEPELLPPPPSPTPTPSPEIVVVPPRVSPVELRAAALKRWSGVGVALAGAVLFGAAAGCTAIAATRGDELRTLQLQNGVWTRHAQDLYDEGLRSQRAAPALWALGGAAVVVGTVLAIVGTRDQRRLQLNATASPSGVSLGLSGKLP